MSCFIRKLPLYLTAGVLLASCTQPVVPNEAKIAAIKEQKTISYRDNLSTQNLRGKIKSITTYLYKGTVKDTSDAAFVSRETDYFDSITGNFNERIIYSTDRFESRETFRYDAKNRKIATLSYTEIGGYQFTIYKQFDEKGNLEEEGQRQADASLLFNTTYKYDDQGNVTQIQSSKAGEENSSYKNIYDREGVLAKQLVTFEKKGEGKITFKYDTAGHVIEYKRLLKGDKLISGITTEYNGQGLPISILEENHDKPSVRTTSQYDQYGNITLQTIQRDASPSKMIAVRYTYDAQGNWIQAVASTDHTKLRFITYY